MTQAATALPADGDAPIPAPTAGEQPTTIETRFGMVSLDPERIIRFPQGILGFSACRQFALLDPPEPTVVFKILQSIDDPELGFLVLPIEAKGGPIAVGDLEVASRSLAIDQATLQALGIITIRADDGISFTVNLRAPLLIDTVRRVGYQYVLPNDSYALRQPLPAAQDAT